MQRYIAFLRGVNLGKRRLPITQLRDSFEEVGFDDVETFIASGGQGAPITDLDNAEFDEPPKTGRATHRSSLMTPASQRAAAMESLCHVRQQPGSIYG